MRFHRKDISQFEQETESRGLCHALIVSGASHTSKKKKEKKGKVQEGILENKEEKKSPHT